MRVRQPAAAVLTVVALAGCAGPQPKADFTGAQIGLNVAFGKPPAAMQRDPEQPTVLVPAPSGVGVIPVPSTPTEPSSVPTTPGAVPTPAPFCPDPDPSDTAPEAAPGVVDGLPKDAGTQVVAKRSSTDARGTTTEEGRGSYASSDAAANPTGGSSFTATLKLFGSETVTTYDVVPPSFSGPVQANTGLISIRSITGDGGLGYQQSFRPKSPLQVFSQPAYSGAAWSGSSSDPTTGTVATISGTVTAEEPVFGCAGIIDAWRTETQIHVTSPNQDLTTTVTTWFATQHGGIPVAQTQSYTGRAGGEDVKGSLEWRVFEDVWSG